MRFQNFGHNVTFTPKAYYEPKSEQEVLDILNRHKEGQVRVAGGRHAWSDGIASNDAFLDIRHLDQIQIDASAPSVTVGGGVKLERLVKVLAKQRLMVPAMGGILKQSVAGLASTATHGTGGPSFSNFVQEMRIAAFDQLGNAKIFEYKTPDELRAARTALGCLGVIISMKISCVPSYWVTERSRVIKTLDEYLADEGEWPLQQSTILPHIWEFFAFQKHLAPEPALLNKIRFALMRFIDYFTVEILPHAILRIILKSRDQKNAILKYYNFMPRLIRGFTVTNPDYKALTLHIRHNYTFDHVEMEVFIPEQQIRPAFAVIRQITDWFAGTIEKLDPALIAELQKIHMLDEVLASRNQFVLHYPMFMRKVFPDDSLIGMTGNNQTYYTIGMFTFQHEESRQGYYAYIKTMAKILNQLFDAKLHWGKYFPLVYQDIERLYPDLEKFKTLCRQVDPHGVFQNYYAKKILGF